MKQPYPVIMTYPTIRICQLLTLSLLFSFETFTVKAQYMLGENSIVATSVETVADSKKINYVVGELFTTITSSDYIFSTTIIDASNQNVSVPAVKAAEQFLVDVYPNPVSDYVQVDPKGRFTDHTYYINIYDLNGKPVIVNDLSNKVLKGKQIINLKAKALASGIYFLQIQSSDLNISTTKRIALAF